MGGDEFVIVAPNMTPEAMSDRAVLFSNLAQNAGRDICGAGFLSLSLGAAFYPKDGTDAEQLLAEADRAMYGAKQRHYERMTAGRHEHTSAVLAVDGPCVVVALDGSHIFTQS